MTTKRTMPQRPRVSEGGLERRADGIKPAETTVDRRKVRGEAKKALILDAALRHFSKSGFSGVSMEEIANTAEISKTNLFYYFNSKDDIYAALIRRLLVMWLAPLRALRMEDDPVVALRHYIRCKLDFSRTHPEASKLFCLEIVQGASLLADDIKADMKELVDAKAAIIRQWSESGKIRTVDPYHLIFTLWSVTQHYADFASQVRMLTDRDLGDHEYFEGTVRNVQDVIMNGVCLSENRFDPETVASAPCLPEGETHIDP